MKQGNLEKSFIETTTAKLLQTKKGPANAGPFKNSASN
jgi:hypothetical protein